ncbi:MAG TPA: tetratricopeptide repeat protein [Chitinophagaceae bacterium]|nr:tetratricopeptide repeat protein [Chitinophagaceae bacterium]
MRQLAAIMFADMAGYTALMQENEQLAKAKQKHLKEVLDSCVKDHRGKVLQNYGDGSLSIFSSAIDGVNCAIEIQKQLQQEPKVDLRIGIHTGDISVEDGTVYGDGVNLASRIESLAVPGSIFISEKVADEVKNQTGIFIQELGYFELKNVKDPVRLFVVSNKGLIIPSRDELKGKTRPPVNRLAVLPFVNLSPDPENEYFSDGITEELLNSLTKVEGLQVTSRTSAFAFKGKLDDIREIASKLNVDKILEGSVRKAANRVRITAQLINAADGYHIWSENYDRDLTDIFHVQDEISTIIANRLRENLSLASKNEHIVKASAKNVNAYTLYLKGLHYWHKLTPADTYKAIECFGQAIELEPGYAQAYAMMAIAYSNLGATGQLKPDKAFGFANQYSDQALKIDSSIAESHIAKARVYLFYETKWQAAYNALQKAMQLNPAYTEAYRLLGYYYIIVGKKQEAVKILEKALEIDPLSTVINNYLGEAYIMAERYDDAYRIAEKQLEINPTMRLAIEMKGWCSGMKGDWKKALEFFQEVHRLANHPLKSVAPLGFAYAKLGETEKALEAIAKLERRQAEEPDMAMDGDLLMVWSALGDREKTFQYVKNCFNKGLHSIYYYLEYPMMSGIKDYPEVREILEKNISSERLEV